MFILICIEIVVFINTLQTIKIKFNITKNNNLTEVKKLKLKKIVFVKTTWFYMTTYIIYLYVHVNVTQ